MDEIEIHIDVEYETAETRILKNCINFWFLFEENCRQLPTPYDEQRRLLQNSCLDKIRSDIRQLLTDCLGEIRILDPQATMVTNPMPVAEKPNCTDRAVEEVPNQAVVSESISGSTVKVAEPRIWIINATSNDAIREKIVDDDEVEWIDSGDGACNENGAAANDGHSGRETKRKAKPCPICSEYTLCAIVISLNDRLSLCRENGP